MRRSRKDIFNEPKRNLVVPSTLSFHQVCKHRSLPTRFDMGISDILLSGNLIIELKLLKIDFYDETNPDDEDNGDNDGDGNMVMLLVMMI